MKLSNLTQLATIIMATAAFSAAHAYQSTSSKKVTTSVERRGSNDQRALQQPPEQINETDTVGTIREIDMNNNRVGVSFQPGHSIHPGDRLVVSFPGGNQCFLPVKFVRARYVIADLTPCGQFKDLRIGQMAERSVFSSTATADELPRLTPPSSLSQSSMVNESTQTVEVTKTEQPVQRSALSIYALYSMASNISADGIVNNRAVGNGDTDNAFGLGIESVNLWERHLGWNAGFSFDFNRTFATDNGGLGSTLASSSRAPTVNFILPYASGNFLVNKNFYGQLGLNYSLPTLGNTNFDPTGKIGYQLGAGFLEEHMQVQLLYRSVHMRATTARNTIDDITVAGPQISAGYVF